MKGLEIVRQKMALLIVLLLIIFFFLVWFGLVQTFISIVKEKLRFSVETCERIGAVVTDPNDPTKKRCL